MKTAVQDALAKGIPVVAAAANLPDPDPGLPASFDGVISLSSVDEQGNFAATLSTSGPGIWFSAPGTNIIVPKLSGGYTTVNGNSAATALTAGVVALIRAKYPTLTPAQIFQRLRATAPDRGPKGLDQKYGYGTIDPMAALTREHVDPSPSRSSWTDPESSEPVAAPSHRYSTAQVITGFVMVAACVLVVVGILAAVIPVVRRRRRSATAPRLPGP